MNTGTKTIHDVIEVTDFDRVFEHLAKVFAMDADSHRTEFKKFKERFEGQKSIQDAFICYGDEKINPVINEMLQRDRDYPTWDTLLRFLLKEKLAETPEQRKYYQSGIWKSMELQSGMPTTIML